MVLEKRENVPRRVRGRFAEVSEDASLVDKLISERREEAKRERSDDRLGYRSAARSD